MQDIENKNNKRIYIQITIRIEGKTTKIIIQMNSKKRTKKKAIFKTKAAMKKSIQGKN